MRLFQKEGGEYGAKYEKVDFTKQLPITKY